ncbi:MAG: ABC transporter substrate-binding protein, partial [Rubrivivax sp.]
MKVSFVARCVTWSLAALLAVGVAQAKDRFTVDLVNEPSSLDPHVQWNPDSYFVYRNIFDNLLTRDDQGEITPQIATSWRQVSDTVTEFRIRTDVTFHDGQKLKPEDVVYSVQRITDPKFASPQRGQFNSIVKAEVGVTDHDNKPAFDEVWASWMRAGYGPVRSFVESRMPE